MSTSTTRPMPAVAWTGLTAVAVAEPVLVCTAVLKMIPASAPHASDRLLLTALLYALPIALLGVARRALGRLLPPGADHRPVLLVWTAGICSTVITWHGAAITHCGDRVFAFIATVLLSMITAYSYARLARLALAHQARGTHYVTALTGSLALIALGTGGALDHTANIFGTICGITIPAAALLWRLLVRDITAPTRAVATAHR